MNNHDTDTAAAFSPAGSNCFSHIRRKLALVQDAELIAEGPVNIVAFGDSVTHGCFRNGEKDYEAVYHAVLARMLREKHPVNPINMINAGIGGITAHGSLARLERDVLSHHPDLVLICFGLNDVNDTLEHYEAALRTFFANVRSAGSDLIFIAPNMMNTRTDNESISDRDRPYAVVTCEYQTGGKMDIYMDHARSIAMQMSVPVCDVYGEWKKLAAEGVDTDALLINGVNHPNREMHRRIAEMLCEMIEGTQ